MHKHLTMINLIVAFSASSFAAEIVPPDGVSGIRGRFINKDSYLEWRRATPLNEIFTAPGEGRSSLAIILDDEWVGGPMFRAYLSHVCRKATEAGKVLSLILEMADWIEAPEVQKQISAALVIDSLFPEQKSLLPSPIFMISQEERAGLAEKIRDLGRRNFPAPQ